ncbi:MAG: hypothetical protein SGPRY_012319 [Prymnesium sp.]
MGLVPLLCLALVTCRLDSLSFESFLLDQLTSDLIGSSGQEAYALCTMQVAMSFLRMFDTSTT